MVSQTRARRTTKPAYPSSCSRPAVDEKTVFKKNNLINFDVLKGHKYEIVPNAKAKKSENNYLYVCKYDGCDKSFSKTWNLVYHFRVHTQEKPFECSHCGKRFSQRGNLGRHLETHELGDVSTRKTFTCKTCQSTYTNIYNLKVGAARSRCRTTCGRRTTSLITLIATAFGRLSNRAGGSAVLVISLVARSRDAASTAESARFENSARPDALQDWSAQLEFCEDPTLVTRATKSLRAQISAIIKIIFLGRSHLGKSGLGENRARNRRVCR